MLTHQQARNWKLTFLRLEPLIGLLLLSLSCASSYARQSSDAGSPSTLIAEDDFLSALIRAKIDLKDRCCRRIGYSSFSGDRLADLESSLTNAFTSPYTGARYNARAATQCIEASLDADCAPVKTASIRISSCDEIYSRGNSEIGEACDSSFDCAQPPGETVRCILTDRDSSGTCKYIREAGEGQPCYNPDPTVYQTCSGDRLCSDDDGRCTALPERGEPCMTGPNWGDTCAAGSMCDRQDSHRCIEPTPIGQACDSIEECEYLACYNGKCRQPQGEVGPMMCE